MFYCKTNLIIERTVTKKLSEYERRAEVEEVEEKNTYEKSCPKACIRHYAFPLTATKTSTERETSVIVNMIVYLL